jgi:phosphate-selective porin OprO and OprP
MRKRRWAATLMALGLVGASGAVAQAQTAARPPVDAGPSVFPYNLPPAPLPGTPAPATVTITPPGGPGRPAGPVMQPVMVPPGMTVAPVVRPAAPPRPSAFADLNPPLIAPVQGTTTAPPAGASTVPAPMPMSPMPGTAVGSSPMTGTPGSSSGIILPAPMGGGTPVQQSTVEPGQTDPKPASDANNPTFTAKWNNGLNFVTADKDWVIHVGGRLQFESVFWSQPSYLKGSAPGNGGIPAATAASGTGVGALDDGMFFRRVRFRSDGTGYGVVEYHLEVDFEQLNFITYDSMWAGFKDVPFLGTVRIGQHKVPQGLDSMTSDYHLTFLERNTLQDPFFTLFAPGIFVANDYFDRAVTVQTMFHRVQPLGFYNEDFGDGNYASTSRVTYTPIYQDDGAIVLHVGGSYQWRTGDLGRTIQPGATGNAFADNADVVRFRSRPELRDATGIGSIGSGVLGGDVGRFVDTGYLLAKSVQTAAPEFLVIYGPLSVQAEAACARVQDARSIYPASAAGRDRGNPTFWGASIQTSYFLTGEHRGYDRRFGTPDRPKVANNFNPKNCGDGEGEGGRDTPAGWGAWELGYRFSYLDLNDDGIAGGLLRQHTLGLNWYFNDNFKVQANYLNINRSVVPPARSGTVHGFGMLAQWYF